MGFDAHAVAAWGIKTTYAAVQAANIETREWIGPKGGDPSFDFNPKTGKPNYKTSSEPPPELDRWNVDTVDGDSENPTGDSVCVVTFLVARTPSHRDTLSVESISTSPRTAAGFADFVRDMTKLGLWSDDRFGLWLYIDVSY